ncbi:MAG: MFS transporter [Pseudohongiellaceae bacterium]|nr:MFS transporter [Pseudohongiellaceae bacterium]
MIAPVKSYIDFLRQRWAMLLFGFACVFWGNFGQSFFVGWFSGDIQSSLGLSAGAYGSAYSAATLTSAFLVAWAGGLIDRVSLHKYVVVVALGLAVASLLLWQVKALWMLLGGLFLLRLCGQALLPHTGSTSMARYFDADRGKAISIAMSGVPVGEVVLPLLAVLLISLIGWQSTFLVIALSIVFLFIPFALFLLHRARPQLERYESEQNNDGAGEHSKGVTASNGRRALIRDYRFWLALPALMVSPFVVTGIFIHQNFVVESKDWTLSWFATCFTVYGLMHWLSSILSGVLVDRFGAIRLLPYVLLPMFLALLLIAWVPGMWVALAVMVLLGLSVGGSPPVTGSLWAEVYGTKAIGSIRSFVVAIMVLASSISPIMFGYFIDQGMGIAALFGGCAVYTIVGIVLICFSYPSSRKAIDA